MMPQWQNCYKKQRWSVELPAWENQVKAFMG